MLLFYVYYFYFTAVGLGMYTTYKHNFFNVINKILAVVVSGRKIKLWKFYSGELSTYVGT